MFAEAAEKGYFEYLPTSKEIEAFHEVEYDERLEALKHSRVQAGLQAIVFSAMCFEAAIYDFASVHLGDDYVRDHLDKLDLLSKWVVVMRFVADVEIPKDQAPYAALKGLILERNRLVHSKSEPMDFSDQERQFARMAKREREFEGNVNNAFRALVLMSLYLDEALDGHHNPLPSFSKLNAPARRYYSALKAVVEECRNVVARMGCNGQAVSKARV